MDPLVKQFMFWPMDKKEGLSLTISGMLHCFGATLLPTYCIYAFQKNAVDSGGDFNADVVDSVKEFYMDNLPNSCKFEA